jgi:Flp pilus assembly protein TadG
MFPALLVTIMLIFQFALFLHAQAVAEAAAQDAAAAARRADGTAAAGRGAAHATLGSLSPRLLSNRVVDVDRSATTATVSVSGTVVSLVPGVKLAVHETASGPVERYVPLPASSAQGAP